MTNPEKRKYKCGNEHLNYRHGMSHTKIHNIWSNMKQRCSNPKIPQYRNWGGRGISVCDRWLDSFDNFYKDMGDCPKGTSIDRIDNDGNYCPENCRWATWNEQVNNRSTNINIKFKGKVQSVAMWAKELGIFRQTILKRLHGGYPTKLALSTTKFSSSPSQPHLQ